MSKGQVVRHWRPAGGGTDPNALRDTLSALIHEAHSQKKSLPVSRSAAPKIETPRAGSIFQASPMLPENLQPLLRETNPRRRLSELVLPKSTRDEIRELIEEVTQASLLRSHSLEPRHTLLLVGPPGTGKTSLAAAVSTELALPFLTVRYEGLVGSYLGETAARLQEIIDYVERTPCVLFFDEFDSVGKERSDAHETGEIKRVVSSLLLHMDALPANCVVICATNHPELLDRAVWRRFELRIELPRPGPAELRDWFGRTQKSFGPIGLDAKQFVDLFRGETFSEIEAITLDARRKVVLSHGATASADAFREAVTRWERRRAVGASTSGQRTDQRADRKARPRTGQARPDKGTKGALPPRDLLSGAGEPPR